MRSHRPRARSRVVALLCCALLGLSACSGDEPDAPPEESSAEPTDAESSVAAADLSRFEQLLAEHREVDHDLGEEPTPEEAYAELLDEHEADLDGCSETAETEKGGCQQPASMTEELEETVNIELLLDASGSMADAARGGTKMQVAQRVLGDFVDTLPENANVSLRVFGHEGTGSAADKKRSCASTELRAPFGKPGAPRLRAGLRSVEPAGWTPLARAMGAAQRDLERVGSEDSSNFVYVLSDGIETCGGDPVAASRRLSGAGVGVDVNIVGFDVDAQAARQLRRAADAAGGSYADAGSADELDDAFGDYDWVAWTQYYNCLYIEAARNYNATAIAAIRSSNCSIVRLTREKNEILLESTSRANTVLTDATTESNAMLAAVTTMLGDEEIDDGEADQLRDQVEERRSAIRAAAEEVRDYVREEAESRHQTLTTAVRAGKDKALGRALAQRDRILDDLEEDREDLEQD